MLVHENIKDLPAKERQDFIWDKIIYANPIKDNADPDGAGPYKPLVTYDNHEEIGKVKQYAPHAGLMLRIRVPNTGAVVELSSKFGAGSGEAVDLIEAAFQAGLVVEGLSFHVGSQMHQLRQLRPGPATWPRASSRKPATRGYHAGEDPRHRRRLSRPLRRARQAVPRAGQDAQRRVRPALPDGHGDPGRARPVPGGHRRHPGGRSHRQGRARRQAVLLHQRRRVPHLSPASSSITCQYHVKAFKDGPTQICAVFGPTCDALDTISLAEELPDLELGDLVYSENIGAYSHASSTYFNGFPPAKVMHMNQ